MKLLAFADVHASTEALDALAKKAKQADVLVCAGDFTVFEEGIEMVLQRLDEMGKTVLLIHGNHEESSLVRQLCKLFKNITYIHKKAHSFKGYVFVGHGGGGFALTDKSFERFAKNVKLPKKAKIVFVTHQPPYNTKLDYIWDHHGNKSYRAFVEKKQPILAISGHLHETQGKKDTVGESKLINPGPKGKIIEV